MGHSVGVWIDHEKAVVVLASTDAVTARTVQSTVEGHPHFGGSQVGGGEKRYEERHRQRLDRYYDEIISQLGRPEALLIMGPGEAKHQFEERLGHSKTFSQSAVTVESADKLTDPQIVAKVKEHFGIA